MTHAEAKQCRAMLAERADRIETTHLDTGGVALTAHWVDGGQRLFYDTDEVRDHIEHTQSA